MKEVPALSLKLLFTYFWVNVKSLKAFRTIYHLTSHYNKSNYNAKSELLYIKYCNRKLLKFGKVVELGGSKFVTSNSELKKNWTPFSKYLSCHQFSEGFIILNVRQTVSLIQLSESTGLLFLTHWMQHYPITTQWFSLISPFQEINSD